MADKRLQQIRARATRMVTENFFIKALSLLLAVSLWAWLQTEQVVDRPSRAQVSYDLPEGLTPVEALARTLVVTVRGPQGRVRALSGGDLSMSVDLSDAEMGKTSIDFSEHRIEGLPAGLEVVQISPPGVELQLDKEINRLVRVRAAVIGDPAEGWKRRSVIVTPPTVEIRGPQSLVRNIAEVSTDIVDISGMRKSIEKKVPLAVDRRTVKPVDQGKVTVSITIDPVMVDKNFPDVPVQLKGAPGWVTQTTAARVSVEGPQNLVQKLSAEDLQVSVLLPDAVPPGADAVDVSWVADDPDSRVLVRLPDGSEAIRVQSVRPSTIRLQPEPSPDE
jgi:YbbR domain-containing protein